MKILTINTLAIILFITATFGFAGLQNEVDADTKQKPQITTTSFVLNPNTKNPTFELKSDTTATFLVGFLLKDWHLTENGILSYDGTLKDNSLCRMKIYAKNEYGYTSALITITVNKAVVQKPQIKNGYKNKMAKQVLTYVNKERKKRGLKKLKWLKTNVKGVKVRAKEYSRYKNPRDPHQRPNKKSCHTAYKSKTGFRGECLASGQKSAKEVVTSWMNSPGHKAIIMNKKAKYLSVSCYYTDNGRSKYVKYYWSLYATSKK